MSRLLKYATVLILFIVSMESVSAQGYYEITTKATESQVKTFKMGIIAHTVTKTVRNVSASLVTKTGLPWVALVFPGKTTQQLHEGLLKFLNYMVGEGNNYFLKCDSASPYLTYRCFQFMGGRDSCFADLIGLTYCRATPSHDTVYFEIGTDTKIFSTIQKAELHITLADDVASVNDVGFNEYEYVQPSGEVYVGGGKNVFDPVKKAPLSLSYPESIFDPAGNVVNAFNKRVIEQYYDRLVLWLNWYLKTYVK